MDYLELREGASAQERAMVNAENAKRTPLTERGRFECMRLCNEAVDALDDCHHSDRVTPELVHRKIGEAQKRQGLQ